MTKNLKTKENTNQVFNPHLYPKNEEEKNFNYESHDSGNDRYNQSDDGYLRNSNNNLKKKPLLRVIENDSYALMACPFVKKHFKSTTIALIVWQLEYWSHIYDREFYKFKEPCNRKAYAPGKSWTESIDISRNHFNKNFDKIGIRYKSKTSYRKALKVGDPFKGKLYLCYYDRQSRMTFYMRNHQLCGEFFSSINSIMSFGNQARKRHSQNEPLVRSSLLNILPLDIKPLSPLKNSTDENLEKDALRHEEGKIISKSQEELSTVAEIPPKPFPSPSSASTPSSLLQTNRSSVMTSQQSNVVSLSSPRKITTNDNWKRPRMSDEEKKKKAEEYVNSFNEIVKPDPTFQMDRSNINHLLKTVKNWFGSDLKHWEEYCYQLKNSGLVFEGGKVGLEYSLRGATIAYIQALKASLKISHSEIKPIEVFESRPQTQKMKAPVTIESVGHPNEKWVDILKFIQEKSLKIHKESDFQTYCLPLKPGNFDETCLKIFAKDRWTADKAFQLFENDFYEAASKHLPHVLSVQIVSEGMDNR